MTLPVPLQALLRRAVVLDDDFHGGLVGQGDPSTIVVSGDRSRPGVVALHGFAGTPREVAVATTAAQALGLSACAPRLPGHTDDVRDLMDVGWDDWVRGAMATFDDVAGRSNGRVVVCGLSMGALLATHLAVACRDRVAGLVVLANAAWLRWSSPRAPLWIFEKTRPFDNRFYMPKKGADIRDPVARRTHMTYRLNPIRSAIDVLRAGRIVRAELGEVACPTLVIHGRLDAVCPVSNARRFAARLGTADVVVRVMSGSAHIVSVDVDRSDVAIEIESFFRRVTLG